MQPQYNRQVNNYLNRPVKYSKNVKVKNEIRPVSPDSVTILFIKNFDPYTYVPYKTGTWFRCDSCGKFNYSSTVGFDYHYSLYNKKIESPLVVCYSCFSTFMNSL